MDKIHQKGKKHKKYCPVLPSTAGGCCFVLNERDAILFIWAKMKKMKKKEEKNEIQKKKQLKRVSLLDSAKDSN